MQTKTNVILLINMSLTPFLIRETIEKLKRFFEGKFLIFGELLN